MLTIPSFESTSIVSDNPQLAVQLSSLFARDGRYLPVVDGPRMTRSDAANEVIRRVNALVSTRVECVLLAGLSDESRNAMVRGCGRVNDSVRGRLHKLLDVLKRKLAA